MKNSFGTSLNLTIFGESHGAYIGAVLGGMPSGIPVNEDSIKTALKKRRPSGNISTARSEKDEFIIASGVFEGKTTGSPLTILIPNTDTRSKDYSKTRGVARPSHADYTAFVKYGGYEDYRGGGHFSGRITAALVAMGAIIQDALMQKGIFVATHIKNIGSVYDRDFEDLQSDIESLLQKDFCVLQSEKQQLMKQQILNAKEQGDSVGGSLESVVVGIPAGVGEPFFDSVESVISHALFSVPAIKGVQFGKGFELCEMYGSAANDRMYYENGTVKTKTNNMGGICGGITNGMPLIVKTAVKPTPTIFKTQDTINFITKQNTKTEQTGRHDPSIVHRVCHVQNAVLAIAVADLLQTTFGEDYLK